MANHNWRKGSSVSWKWGSGTATGKIAEIHREKITRQLQGAEVTRNGSDDDPALLIEQDDGDRILKLASEVKAAD